MLWQTLVGGLHQVKQLAAIALKLESGAQQLWMLAHQHQRRLFAERIGRQIGYDPLGLASHVACLAYRERYGSGDTISLHCL